MAARRFGGDGRWRITVPTYTTNTVDDHAYIFEHAEAKAVIVSSAALAALVLPAAGRAGCALVISLDPAVDGPAARAAGALLGGGRRGRWRR